MSNPVRLIAIVAVALIAATASAQEGQILDVWVAQPTTCSGSQEVSIPVHLRNYSDQITGFTMLLQLDRSDIMSLRAVVDTVGTLTGGWEVMEARNTAGVHSLKVTGFCEVFPPQTAPPLSPQTGQIPLFKIIADMYEVPDTLADRTATVMIETGLLENFNFSDPVGRSIGFVRDSVWDTAYYACAEWDGPTCLTWEQVYPPDPYDSLLGYWQPVSYLDTAHVSVEHGSVTVFGAYQCGDHNGDATLDIGDLVHLVEFMFEGGAPPVDGLVADCTGDGILDIADLTCTVDFMFNQGDEPTCCQ